VSQQRNPLWIANQLRRDNQGQAPWTARVQFGSSQQANGAILNLAQHDARAVVEGQPAEVTIEFDAPRVTEVARIIVAHAGKLLFGTSS
jgi:hypothetical protein